MADRSVVAIHQPNFFPWLGFFDKLARADVFVLLDIVEAPGGSSWTNRVRGLVDRKVGWLTMPLSHKTDEREIRLLKSAESPWRKTLVKSIKGTYGRAPAFGGAFPVLEPLLDNPSPGVADYNVNAVLELARALELDAGRIVLASSLAARGRGTALLASIVSEVGGTTYLSGDGSDGYLDEAHFDRTAIGLEYQRFRHPAYTQHRLEEFVPGLSIIDALLNCGFDGVRRLLQQAEELRR